MMVSGNRSNLGQLITRSARILVADPAILIPSAIPAIWQFIGPRIGLISPSAAQFASSLGVGINPWRWLGYMLIYVIILAISQGATIALVRRGAQRERVDLAEGFGEAFARFVPLLGVSVAAGLIVSIASLAFFFPGLIAAFFLWYIVQAVIIDEAPVLDALRKSFRFAATYAGETFVILLAALVVSFLFSLIPFVDWLLMIPTTAFMAAWSTLLYIERET